MSQHEQHGAKAPFPSPENPLVHFIPRSSPRLWTCAPSWPVPFRVSATLINHRALTASAITSSKTIESSAIATDSTWASRCEEGMVKVITDMWRYEPAQGKGENSHQIVVDSVVVDALLLLLWLWFYEIEYVCRSLLSWSSFHSKMSKIPRRDHFKIKASQIFIGFVFVSLLTYNPDVFGRDFAVSRRQSSSPRFRICHQLRRLAS